MTMTQSGVFEIETQPQDESQIISHGDVQSFERPLSVRDRIRLMNLDASSSTSNGNGIGVENIQHHDQQHQPQQFHQPLSSSTPRNKRFFPPVNPSSVSHRRSVDDSGFTFVQSAV